MSKIKTIEEIVHKLNEDTGYGIAPSNLQKIERAMHELVDSCPDAPSESKHHKNFDEHLECLRSLRDWKEKVKGNG